MPNDQRSLTTYNSAIYNQIGIYVGEAIIAIQKQQPELILKKYRNIQWQSAANQSTLITKFTQLLSQVQDWDTLIQRLKLYLKALLVPESFTSPNIEELMVKVQQLKPAVHTLNGTKNSHLQPTLIPSSLRSNRIAVLLLDAENLQVSLDTEKFLTTVCTCPIQIKIAFANWSNRGKLDVELHERGYDLIHVPSGRDNADGKMIAFGSSIHERYPNTQEVLVCSSDKVMTNLCNHLQQNGLTVYQVSQQGEHFTVYNNYTGKIVTQIPHSLPEMPTQGEFVRQIKELIKSEQKAHNNYWIKLAVLSKLYKSKYNFTISQVVAQYFPGKKAKDIFLNYPDEFVIHQINEDAEIYVTNFTSSSPLPDHPSLNSRSSLLLTINSPASLEAAIGQMIRDLALKSSSNYVSVGILNSSFQQQYGKSITDQVKALQIGSKFLKFLQSCSSLELKPTEKGWEVAIRS